MSACPRLRVDATRDPGDRVAYEVVLENPGDAPFTRTLPTSKTVDVTARTEDGRVVHVYGEGLLFLQAFTTLTVPAGEHRRLAADAFDAPPGPVTLDARLPGEGPGVEARIRI